MTVVNEHDMEWTAGAMANLKVKNLLTDYAISAGSVSCGIAAWPCGEAGKPHTHAEQDEIYIILRGSGIANIGGELRELKTGDIVHAPCGEVHGMVRGTHPDGVEMFYILIPHRR